MIKFFVFLILFFKLENFTNLNNLFTNEELFSNKNQFDIAENNSILLSCILLYNECIETMRDRLVFELNSKNLEYINIQNEILVYLIGNCQNKMNMKDTQPVNI